MPRDSGGTYSLPSGSTATTGTTILASEHNTPLSDIASALTASLPVDGSKGMSGVLKVSDGSAANPSVALASDTTTGFFKKAAAILAVAFGGIEYGGFVPIGTVVPFAGSSAPAGWMVCDGSAISRTTYAALFAVIGTTFGTGDGSTTFNLPDATGRTVAGKEATATRLTSAGSGIDGGTLGSTGGAQNKTIATTNLPASGVSITVPSTPLTTSDDATQILGVRNSAGYSVLQGGSSANVYEIGSFQGAYFPGGTYTSSNLGSGTALAVAQPTIVLNFIIKT